jgi:hypothetical protein
MSDKSKKRKKGKKEQESEGIFTKISNYLPDFSKIFYASSDEEDEVKEKNIKKRRKTYNNVNIKEKINTKRENTNKNDDQNDINKEERINFYNMNIKELNKTKNIEDKELDLEKELKNIKEKREKENFSKETLDSILKITKRNKIKRIINNEEEEEEEEGLVHKKLPNSAFTTPNKLKKINGSKTPTFVEKAKILLTPIPTTLKRKRETPTQINSFKKLKLEKIEGNKTPISYSKTAKKILEKIDEISTPYKDIQKIYSEKKEHKKPRRSSSSIISSNFNLSKTINNS